jgi:allophanate hydrolase
MIERIRETYRRIRERGDDGVWISLFDEEQVIERAKNSSGPLSGKLVAVKDNIDVAGLPTTAGCPEFAYTPERNAFVVQKLIDAGALVIGKTNLDQFATGLNGTRTPYTIPRNEIDKRYISGGSSSGSAVAVAAGLVDFALGTDTAGSGRVPAGFHGIVGFKPTKGRWSTSGLVPACRSLDCITVFTKTLGEAALVDEVIAGFDEADPFSRHGENIENMGSGKRVAVLRPDQREFFGDTEYARLYEASIDRARALDWSVTEFDATPFLDAAALLYAGPWVAERYVAIRSFLETHAESVHPVVRGIIESGKKFSAADAFEAQYKLAAFARKAEGAWKNFDAMLLPTAGTIYTVDQMLAEPVALNSNLGRYTNFVNLLDLCGIAIPAGKRPDGLPFGVTLLAPAWSEKLLLALGQEFLA